MKLHIPLVRASLALAWIAVACASSEGTRQRPDAGPSDSDDAGGLPPAPDADTCASADFRAESTRRPIDIVIWVDDGGSFIGARGKVADSIQERLVDILERDDVDYRFAVMTAQTRFDPPLSTDPERFCRVGDGFSSGGGGFIFFADRPYIDDYRPCLRDGAFRVLLSATDCQRQSPIDFAEFERRLEANGMGAFVVGDERNYVYHMLGNLALRDPQTEPWRADEMLPVGAAAAGFTNCSVVQEGAVATGGLRLGVSAADYGELFEAIADASVAESRLPCTFDPPEGSDIDLRYVRFRYRPEGDATMEEEYHEVADATACTDEGGFYPSMDQLHLCPTTCERVSSDPAAEVRFTFECVPF